MHHKTQMLESPKMQAEAEACWSHASLGYDLVLKKKKKVPIGERKGKVSLKAKEQRPASKQGTVAAIPLGWKPTEMLPWDMMSEQAWLCQLCKHPTTAGWEAVYT